MKSQKTRAKLFIGEEIERYPGIQKDFKKISTSLNNYQGVVPLIMGTAGDMTYSNNLSLFYKPLTHEDS